MSPEQQFDELDVLDNILTERVEYLLSDSKNRSLRAEELMQIHSACLAGDPIRPWLVVAVGSEDPDDNKVYPGYTLAIVCKRDDYDFLPVGEQTPHGEKPTIRKGKPWLKAVDFDGDGDTEILETWRNQANGLLNIAVHKYLPTVEWKRILYLSNLYLGQVRIEQRIGQPPALVVADGIPLKGK